VKIIKAKDRISPKEWNEFFNSACHKRNGNYKFTDQKNESDFFYYSKVFKIQTEPSFITDSRLLETKYGYCTIVKYKEYILINSKFCSLNKEVIKIIGTELPFEEFTKYFTKDTAEFEKITLSNSSIMSGIRSRIIEGQKLQENFRPIYSSKHVLKAFRVLQDGVVFSQSPSTSKLNYRNGKLKVEEYINWCKTIIDSINTNNSSKYFDNFAKPVDISKMKELVPTIIFIDLNFLKDYNTNIWEPIQWRAIEALYASKSNRVIVPLQDILGLGADSRMNTPSTVGDNWAWRVYWEYRHGDLENKLYNLAKRYQRI